MSDGEKRQNNWENFSILILKVKVMESWVVGYFEK